MLVKDNRCVYVSSRWMHYSNYGDINGITDSFDFGPLYVSSEIVADNYSDEELNDENDELDSFLNEFHKRRFSRNQ